MSPRAGDTIALRCAVVSLGIKIPRWLSSTCNLAEGSGVAVPIPTFCALNCVVSKAKSPISRVCQVFIRPSCLGQRYKKKKKHILSRGSRTHSLALRKEEALSDTIYRDRASYSSRQGIQSLTNMCHPTGDETFPSASNPRSTPSSPAFLAFTSLSYTVAFLTTAEPPQIPAPQDSEE